LDKKCTYCNKLKPLNLFRDCKGGRNGKRSQCKECDAKKQRQRRIDNPEKANQIEANYRARNPEKRKELNIRQAKIKIENNKRYRDNLSESYVRELLSKHHNIPPKEIPEELIKIKRLLIKIERKVKSKK